MKISVRKSVFETNSSSTHSLTMCSAEEYDRWSKGDIYFNADDEKFVTEEEILKEMKENEFIKDNMSEEEIEEAFDEYTRYDFLTKEEFFDCMYLESFKYTYTTKSGEKVIAFGRYGWDG